MPLNTLTVAATVTPTVIKTYISHYTNREPRHQKPTAHISYDEGLNLIRTFLDRASHSTVEELQAFTSTWVPNPRWVKVDAVAISAEYITKAANVLIDQLGHHGINRVGGSQWWQWRRNGSGLKAEWIEMRKDYQQRRKDNDKGRRVMLYVHGGGYFFGSVDEHRYQMQRHARKLRARVFAPRYRLAPQFPFPCGLQDCLAAYLYLLTVQEPSEIILAGDSAGGGMVVSMLVTLRDQGLPLPAGAVLISPWVDPTQSFPSVAGDSSSDYIPPHGFMQKPSAAWPPPNDDEMQAIAEGAISQAAGEALPRKSSQQARHRAEKEAVEGFVVYHEPHFNDETARENPNYPATKSESNPRAGSRIPGPGYQLSIELDGNLIVLKDQIQMYTTNPLLAYPLVCPVVQPSLGGLPPMLIMTGGGEILRDEQIYLAHKAANPERYPPGEAYMNEYDPDGTILHKYKPTYVQLQVWDDLCHVAPALSFTRPAKYMYRSIAQWSAWALARAQQTSIEITHDDDMSLISSGSEEESENEDTPNGLARRAEKMAGHIGKAGSPLPPFKDHMIRQRVDRHGAIWPLAPAHTLPACQLNAEEVGVIKAGPVKKWLMAKQKWDTKYAREKRRIQKRRIKEMALGGSQGFGSEESPPPSALAGRRSQLQEKEVRRRKSYGLMLWSLFGSKHDEHTIEREEEALKQEAEDRRRRMSDTKTEESNRLSAESPSKTSARSGSRRPTKSSGSRPSMERARRKTMTVVDAGQTEGDNGEIDPSSPTSARPDTPTIHAGNAWGNADSAHFAPPTFFAQLPNKNLTHLRHADDHASLSTSADVETLRNASTTAVFSAPGVLPGRSCKGTNALMLSPRYADSNADGLRSEVASTMMPETPVSRRSVERLQEYQGEGGRQDALRSPSMTAVMKVPGVVGIVGDEHIAESNGKAELAGETDHGRETEENGEEEENL